MNFKYFKIGALIPTIIILAVLLEPFSNWIVAQLETIEWCKKAVPFVDAVSTLGMLSAILAFLNYEGWKWWIFKWLVNVPNLNGRYVGKLTSSYPTPQGTPTIKDCVLEIRQTASAIHINAYTGDMATNILSSKSSTTPEQFLEQTSGFFDVLYIFSNTPNAMAPQLHNHDGTARLTYYPDTKTLDGFYYNQRKNDGTIVVRFESSKRLGRLK